MSDYTNNQVILVGFYSRELNSYKRALEKLQNELNSYIELLANNEDISKTLKTINTKVQIFKKLDTYILIQEYSEHHAERNFAYMLTNCSVYISSKKNFTDYDYEYIDGILKECKTRVENELKNLEKMLN